MFILIDPWMCSRTHYHVNRFMDISIPFSEASSMSITGVLGAEPPKAKWKLLCWFLLLHLGQVPGSKNVWCGLFNVRLPSSFNRKATTVNLSCIMMIHQDGLIHNDDAQCILIWTSCIHMSPVALLLISAVWAGILFRLIHLASDLAQTDPMFYDLCSPRVLCPPIPPNKPAWTPHQNLWIYRRIYQLFNRGWDIPKDLLTC